LTCFFFTSTSLIYSSSSCYKKKPLVILRPACIVFSVVFLYSSHLTKKHPKKQNKNIGFQLKPFCIGQGPLRLRTSVSKLEMVREMSASHVLSDVRDLNRRKRGSVTLIVCGTDRERLDHRVFLEFSVDCRIERGGRPPRDSPPSNILTSKQDFPFPSMFRRTPVFSDLGVLDFIYILVSLKIGGQDLTKQQTALMNPKMMEYFDKHEVDKRVALVHAQVPDPIGFGLGCLRALVSRPCLGGRPSGEPGGPQCFRTWVSWGFSRSCGLGASVFGGEGGGGGVGGPQCFRTWVSLVFGLSSVFGGIPGGRAVAARQRTPRGRAVLHVRAPSLADHCSKVGARADCVGLRCHDRLLHVYQPLVGAPRLPRRALSSRSWFEAAASSPW
jgi:hypothetical protein